MKTGEKPRRVSAAVRRKENSRRCGAGHGLRSTPLLLRHRRATTPAVRGVRGVSRHCAALAARCRVSRGEEFPPGRYHASRRPRKLRITRPGINARTRSLRCSSSSPEKRVALSRGPRFIRAAHNGSVARHITPRLCAAPGFAATPAGLRAAQRPSAHRRSAPSGRRTTARSLGISPPRLFATRSLFTTPRKMPLRLRRRLFFRLRGSLCRCSRRLGRLSIYASPVRDAVTVHHSAKNAAPPSASPVFSSARFTVPRLATARSLGISRLACSRRAASLPLGLETVPLRGTSVSRPRSGPSALLTTARSLSTPGAAGRWREKVVYSGSHCSSTVPVFAVSVLGDDAPRPGCGSRRCRCSSRPGRGT